MKVEEDGAIVAPLCRKRNRWFEMVAPSLTLFDCSLLSIYRPFVIHSHSFESRVGTISIGEEDVIINWLASHETTHAVVVFHVFPMSREMVGIQSSE